MTRKSVPSPQAIAGPAGLNDSVLGMDDAPFCYAIVDLDMRVQYANGAFRRLCDGSPVGSPLAEIAPISPDLVAAAVSAASGASVLELEVEQAGRHQLVSCFPVRGGGDHPIGAAVAFRDITEWVDDRRRGERLQQVSAELSGAPRIESIAEVVLGRGREALGASAGVIALMDSGGSSLTIAGQVGFDESVEREWHSFPVESATPMGDAVRSRKPVFVDLPEQRRQQYPDLPLPGDSTSATVPLIAGDRVLGALTFRFAGGRPIGDGIRGFVVALGNQCAQAIDRAKLYEAENEARRRAERLADISVRLAVATQPAEVTEITAEAGVRVLGASAAAVVLADGEQLQIMSSRGFAVDVLDRWRSFDRNHRAPLAESIRTGQPIFIDSRETAGRLYPDLEEAAEQHNAWAAVPLAAHGRERWGARTQLLDLGAGGHRRAGGDHDAGRAVCPGAGAGDAVERHLGREPAARGGAPGGQHGLVGVGRGIQPCHLVDRPRAHLRPPARGVRRHLRALHGAGSPGRS